MTRAVHGESGRRSGRGEATTEALHRAVHQLIEEVGYRALTIEGVAQRSGVAKTTIYRRWPSKAEMVFDLMLHSSAELPPLDDQGSLTGDIDALSARIVALVAGSLGSRIFPGLICDAASDRALMQRFRATFVAEGRGQIAGVLDRSVRRGDLTDATAAADLQAVLLGAALTFPLLQPDLDESALQLRLTELAMAVVCQRQSAP